MRVRAAAHDDVFEEVSPPFDLVSDMLLTGATCPLAPLEHAFPDRPFLSMGGRAVLGIWFARVLQARTGPGGDRLLGPENEPENFPYAELNVGVLLRGRRMFVPGIYATSELTLRLGHRYGMPKRRARMTYEVAGREVRSRTVVDGVESRVRARMLPSGRMLETFLARTFPWWSWPVDFPSGSCIQSQLEGAAGARLAWVREGRVALDEPWLPRPVSLWRVALHVPRQRMKLPSPFGADGGPPRERRRGVG